MKIIFCIVFFVNIFLNHNVNCAINSEEEVGNGRYTIEGRVIPPEELEQGVWQVDYAPTKIF